MSAARLLQLARSHDVMIATAESCTGGMLSAALTDIAGSSEMFERGFITYSNAAKTEMLGVLPETLARFGAVSEPVALEMATGALAHSNAALAISITGVAGPGSSANKPEGRVCFGLAYHGRESEAETIEFGPRGRDYVRIAARDHALFLLIAALSD